MLGATFVGLGGGISMSAFSFCGSGFAPCWDTISPKSGTDVHLKWHLFLFSFRYTCLQIFSTLCNVSSWPFPLASYPTTNMSLAILNTFGNSLKISSTFLWNLPPTRDAPNGNLLYLYLPNWQVSGFDNQNTHP